MPIGFDGPYCNYYCTYSNVKFIFEKYEALKRLGNKKTTLERKAIYFKCRQ